ncbi:hypothetical protein KCP70_23640 [Salmonella enterica subsp. enterica]|nr:hypothetical protein KCP70_23640 [Salmonella enterica subsp. enterica]
MPPGEHGFHIHANGNASPRLKTAKQFCRRSRWCGHLDPQIPASMKGRKVKSIWATSVLVVNNDGITTEPIYCAASEVS